MEKDEIKTTEQPAADAGQTENTQSVETAETPDTATDGGAEVERPDAPRDGEGCEGVTVVIIEHDEQRALLTARSVKQNLLGVDALTVRIAGENDATDAQALQRFVNEACPTERIVLMTDEMVILNPVTLPHIALPKAMKVGANEQGDDILSFSTRIPQMMYKSVLVPMLKEIVELYPHTDIFDAYGHEAFKDVRPVMLPAWNQDSWLLPVVSKNPPMEALQKWGKAQRFAWISPQSWSKTVVKFLEERFPE